MEYDNTNSGALFKNDKKEKETRPDYIGSINVGGKDFWISSWLKTSQKGQKFMSLAVTEKDAQPQTQKAAPEAPVDVDFDDDIPF